MIILPMLSTLCKHLLLHITCKDKLVCTRSCMFLNLALAECFVIGMKTP